MQLEAPVSRSPYLSTKEVAKPEPHGAKVAVDKLFVQDGNTKYVDQYADEYGMDDANKRIMMIFKTQGEAAGFKALMTREDGTQMSYAESRARYG
jgi:hypothetical protein